MPASITIDTTEPSRSVRPEVLDMLDAAIEQAKLRDREDLVLRLTTERAVVLHPPCTVLVVGEFNKGKSSLVNALLNVRVCATDADVATALPTFVRYGPELAGQVRTAAGVSTAIEPDAVELLATRRAPATTQAPVTPTGHGWAPTAAPPAPPPPPLPGGPPGRPAGGDEPVAVEVTLPRALLRDGLVLVDTPGVGGGLTSAHAAATIRALPGADAVVFVTDASQELTSAEVDLLRTAHGLCPRLVCVLTKIDFYPQWRRIMELNAGHLRRAGLPQRMIALSSPLRQLGLRTGDRELVAESGFPELAAFLRDCAAGNGGSAQATAAAAAHSALSQLAGRLATEHAALASPETHAARLAAWTEAKQRAEELRSGAARWQQTLADRINDMYSTVDLDLGVRLRAVRKQAGEKISTANPQQGMAEVEPWVYRTTNEALADHLRVIRDQADAVADEVAGQFGEAAFDLRVQLDIPVIEAGGVDLSGREVGAAARAASRSSRVELGIAAARGGSAGAVLTHAAGLLLGLALPVTLPITALLAGVLAQKTWRVAKSNQLRMLRAEADRAVGIYLEETEMRARKDSRDSVRGVQRQLREVFTRQAAELHASSVDNLEALANAVREDERTRKQRLGTIGAELTALRVLVQRASALTDELLADDPPALATPTPATQPPTDRASG